MTAGAEQLQSDFRRYADLIAQQLRGGCAFVPTAESETAVQVERGVVLIDAAALVIDCSANMTAADIAQRCAPLVALFRQQHPQMPILLLDERPQPDGWATPELARQHAEKSAALKAAHEQLAAAGDTRVFFRGDEGLIGDDGEATVDGSHPTDLGMMRYADALEPELRKFFAGGGSAS